SGRGMGGTITYGTVHSVHVTLGSGNNTLNIQSTSTNTTVDGGPNQNTFNVGSYAPYSGGTPHLINGPLTVNGNAGLATLNVDDTGAPGDTGSLRAMTISGLGLAGGITYGTLTNLNINLASNAVFTILGTHLANTTIHDGYSGDMINVQTISGPTTVDGGYAVDTVNVGSLAPAAGGIVDHIASALTFNG